MEDQFRKHLLAAADAAVGAAMPGPALRGCLSLEGDVLHARCGETSVSYDLSKFERVMVLGAGKAAAAMARTVEDLLGDRISSGVAVTKYGHCLDLRTTCLMEAAHPVPDAAGTKGGEALLEAARSAGEKDLVIFLLSGGASALTPVPAPGLTLENKQSVTRLLLKSGATINELNAVRKHLSAFKGGGAATALYPATTLSLIVSDVVGNRLDVIGSGPCAPDPSTFGDCLEILNRYGLTERTDPAVLKHLESGHLESGGGGAIPETPKAGDPVFDKVINCIIADNGMAVDAAARSARENGYEPLVLTSSLEGEAREVAKFLIATAREVVNRGNPLKSPACILAGGETTVTIRGRGKGGRNQELALAAALAAEGAPELKGRCALMSLGTDGTDGPTDAAGGLALPGTLQRMQEAGVNPVAALENNDAYHALKAADDLLITGPTRTNVMDVVMMLVK